MLPRVNVVVPTDNFYALSMDEARQLNENGGDIITGEDFPRGRERYEAGATFRITTRGADGRQNHQYYDAATLWRWAQDHRTDPRRNPWWHEDWMELHDEYAPGSLVPHWVNMLPRANGVRSTFDAATQTRLYWDDSGEQSPNPRVSYKVDSSGARTTYAWNAEKGINYRMKKEYPPSMPEVWLAGSTEFFKFYDQPDPIFQSVSDDKNYSRLVSHENRTKGWTRYYEGPARGGERMMRQKFNRPGVDELWYYGNNPGEGRGDEYKIMIVHGFGSAARGQTWSYIGNVKGEETLRLVKHSNGQKDHYAGQRGQEVKYRSIFRTANMSIISLDFNDAGDVIVLQDDHNDTTTHFQR